MVGKISDEVKKRMPATQRVIREMEADTRKRFAGRFYCIKCEKPPGIPGLDEEGRCYRCVPRPV